MARRDKIFRIVVIHRGRHSLSTARTPTSVRADVPQRCPQRMTRNQVVFHSRPLVTHMVIHSEAAVRYLSRGAVKRQGAANRPTGTGETRWQAGGTSQS